VRKYRTGFHGRRVTAARVKRWRAKHADDVTHAAARKLGPSAIVAGLDAAPSAMEAGLPSATCARRAIVNTQIAAS
jgi:hypothetical protein